MKRPFLIVALLYIGGILLGEFFHPPLLCLFAASFLAALGGLVWNRARIFLLAAALILAGWTNIAWRTSVLSPNDLRLLIADRTESVSLRGTLDDTPVERLHQIKEEERWRSRAVLDVKEIRLNEVWQAASGRVSVGISGLLPSNYFSGQTVEIAGVLSPPAPPRAPGLFDSRNYLKRLEIYYQVETKPDDWQMVVEGPLKTRPLSDRFQAWAKKTLALGLPEEDLSLRLIWTLMLDWKAPMTDVVEEPFVRAGTYHIFAVDGLRIGLISSILILLFRVLQVPRNVAGLFGIPTIWFYVALTGFPASAVRAGIMMTVVFVGWALRRPGNLLNSLFAAAFIILLWNPQQLFQAGFQLSFLVVLCIVLLVPLMDKKVQEWLKGDPFLPSQLETPTIRFSKKTTWLGYRFLGVSLGAWLGAIPLGAYFFHVFNPISVFSNFLVVPLTVFSLCSGFGSLLVAPLCPAAAELFNHAGWFIMKCITGISQWSAGLPYACVNVSAPGPVLLLGYYCVLLGVGTGWIFKVKYKRALLAGYLSLVVLWMGQLWLESRCVELHVLPLQGGQAILVDSFGLANDLLIDCGDEGSATAVTKPFLCAQGINGVPNFCLTHATQRQMGGGGVVLTNFSVEHALTSSAKGRSVVYRRFVTNLEAQWPSLRRFVMAGDKIGSWTVLHPSAADHFTTADDNAVVLYGQIGGKSVLLLSDLSRAGQNALVERNPALRADIIIAGLPGKDEPVCDWLLDIVQPRLIVITDSELPPTRRASAGLRERLSQRETPVIFCREVGALTFCFEPDKWSVRNSSTNLFVGF